jgi:hypothetical protein
MDPCSSGVNLNEVLIADSRERNQTARALGGNVLDVAKCCVGAWAATSIVDSIGSNSGGNTTSNNSSTITTSRDSMTNSGDGTLSHFGDSTTTTTDTTTTSQGCQ